MVKCFPDRKSAGWISCGVKRECFASFLLDRKEEDYETEETI